MDERKLADAAAAEFRKLNGNADEATGFKNVNGGYYGALMTYVRKRVADAKRKG